jgi:hypothetical protein
MEYLATWDSKTNFIDVLKQYIDPIYYSIKDCYKPSLDDLNTILLKHNGNNLGLIIDNIEYFLNNYTVKGYEKEDGKHRKVIDIVLKVLKYNQNNSDKPMTAYCLNGDIQFNVQQSGSGSSKKRSVQKKRSSKKVMSKKRSVQKKRSSKKVMSKKRSVQKKRSSKKVMSKKRSVQKKRSSKKVMW